MSISLFLIISTTTIGSFYQFGWWIRNQFSNFINWYMSLDIFGMMMLSMILSIVLSYLIHWLMSMISYILCCGWCRRRPRAAMTGVHIHSPPRPPSPHNMYRNVIIYNNQPPPRGLGLSMAAVDVLPEVPASLNTNSSDPLLVHAQKIGDVENNSNYNNPLLRQPSAPPFDANTMTPSTSNSRTKDKKEQERPMYA